ncbi:hypothetical protein Y032_0218g2418 [Ancylostoma ceylanicum]|uniref:Uncharacterized protein n=1 Tax=Ancylostoma ceylanicum TaxID=53326 RepID=A0A016SIY8_9BILA|nr:hypothetical protein Y032_0218g2418 [Ancylostoma ceylanicum]
MIPDVREILKWGTPCGVKLTMLIPVMFFIGAQCRCRNSYDVNFMREYVHLHPICLCRIIHKGLFDRVDLVSGGVVVIISVSKKAVQGSIPAAVHLFAFLFQMLFSFENLFYAIL